MIDAVRPWTVEKLAASRGAEQHVGDAIRVSEVDACVVFAMERFGRITGIANCVGSLPLKPAHLTTERAWSGTLATVRSRRGA